MVVVVKFIYQNGVMYAVNLGRHDINKSALKKRAARKSSNTQDSEILSDYTVQSVILTSNLYRALRTRKWRTQGQPPTDHKKIFILILHGKENGGNYYESETFL